MSTRLNIAYPFTQEEVDKAAAEWGCNCGPTALSFACQVPLAAARYAIKGFDAKRYTSPSMMKAALGELKRAFVAVAPAPYKAGAPVDIEPMFDGIALVRLQWTGPWTKPGSNPRWAYGYTHWIACWKHQVLDDIGLPGAGRAMVFDVNGGVLDFDEWEADVLPHLLKIPRGDGGWFPTHIWRLT